MIAHAPDEPRSHFPGHPAHPDAGHANAGHSDDGHSDPAHPDAAHTDDGHAVGARFVAGSPDRGAANRAATEPATPAPTGAPADHANAPAPPPHEVEAFVVELGAALHRFGAPSHRLEAAMSSISARLGLSGQFFTLPTVLQASFERADGQHTRFVRVEPGADDLGRLSDLDAVVTALARGRTDFAAARSRVRAILDSPDLHHPAVQVLCFGLAAAAAARFLGGGLAEIALGGVLGLLTGLLDRARSRVPSTAPIFEFIAASCAALVALAAAACGVTVATDIAALAGVIVLVPGFTMTIAVTEVATRHLASGSTRLVGALVSFCSIAFGAAVGNRLGSLVFGAVATHAPAAPPAMVEWLALAIAPLVFARILRARLVDWPWISAVGVLAYAGTHAGARLLGPELGALFGAFAVAAASNALARLRDRPASVTLVPGILLLVPGSLGVKSLAALFQRDVIHGVEHAVAVVLIAFALVSGLLLANVLVPSRRTL